MGEYITFGFQLLLNPLTLTQCDFRWGERDRWMELDYVPSISGKFVFWRFEDVDLFPQQVDANHLGAAVGQGASEVSDNLCEK